MLGPCYWNNFCVQVCCTIVIKSMLACFRDTYHVYSAYLSSSFINELMQMGENYRDEVLLSSIGLELVVSRFLMPSPISHSDCSVTLPTFDWNCSGKLWYQSIFGICGNRTRFTSFPLSILIPDFGDVYTHPK